MHDLIDYSTRIIEIIKTEKLDKKKTSDLDLITSLHECIVEINKSSDKTISHNHLVDTVNSKFSFENEQQDSFELYHRINQIYEDFSDHLFKSVSPNLENILKNPFMISYKTTMRCSVCNQVLTREEKNYEITVSPHSGQVI